MGWSVKHMAMQSPGAAEEERHQRTGARKGLSSLAPGKGWGRGGGGGKKRKNASISLSVGSAYLRNEGEWGEGGGEWRGLRLQGSN